MSRREAVRHQDNLGDDGAEKMRRPFDCEPCAGVPLGLHSDVVVKSDQHVGIKHLVEEVGRRWPKAAASGSCSTAAWDQRHPGRRAAR